MHRDQDWSTSCGLVKRTELDSALCNSSGARARRPIHDETQPVKTPKAASCKKLGELCAIREAQCSMLCNETTALCERTRVAAALMQTAIRVAQTQLLGFETACAEAVLHSPNESDDHNQRGSQ